MDTRDVDARRRARRHAAGGRAQHAELRLLAELGRVQRPVLLKRGLSATIKELLMAAEYIMAHGNTTWCCASAASAPSSSATRNTLDVAAVPVLKRETHLPVIVDPSHAGGVADLVAPLSFAGDRGGRRRTDHRGAPDPESRSPTATSRCHSKASAS